MSHQMPRDSNRMAEIKSLSGQQRGKSMQQGQFGTHESSSTPGRVRSM